MTKKIRKGFACVLSLCMVMALLPFSALAIDEDAGTFSDYSIAAGSITGTTAITINDTVGEDDSLVYTIGSAEVTGLTTDSTVSDYSAFTSGGNIAVTEGQYVTVYEIITATEAVVKYVSLEITADNIAAENTAGTFSDYSIAAGSVTGTTAITVNDTVGEDDSLVYTIGSTEVTGLTTDSTVSDYSAFTSGGDIAVTEGQYVTVYEIITATEAVVKYVSLEITADNIASDYTLSIGTASTGGAGYTRDITIGGTKSDNLAGDYLVVQFTSGSGTSAKVSVVIIELTGSDKTVTVSYQTSGTAIATWLTNGIPDLTASTLDVEEYATATAN